MRDRIWTKLLVCLACVLLVGSGTAAGEVYRLGPGDLMAVIAHGVVGKFGQAPVHFPSAGQDFEPVMGFPYSVQDDGCLHLPLIEAVAVRGMTVAEAQRAVSVAYVEAKVQTRANMVALALMRKRQVHAVVIHSSPQGGPQSIDKVSLSADQATLLAAVAQAGRFDQHASIRVLSPGNSAANSGSSIAASDKLGEGAVIELRSPSRYRYFTGGLIAGGEHLLPPTGGLNALQAIAAAGGYRQSGWLPPHRLTILSSHAPTYSLPLAQLLNNPQAYPVLPGDTLIVR